MTTLCILGSTGSIGTQTLDIVREFPERFQVRGLSAGKNIDLIRHQIKEFSPHFVCVQYQEDYEQLRGEFPKTTFFCGAEGLVTLAEQDYDLTVVAIVGTTALKATEVAIRSGSTIGLACKEVLVTAGDLFMKLARDHNVAVLPIDSEHAALKQCLAGIDEDLNQIEKLILTASGGPFFGRSKEELTAITPADALKHPNWDMGAKITIDSATLMNKGLEVIEAHHLFQVPYSQIEVLVHPTSIVHSMVEFTDGTVLAQMGSPDMRFPIQYALTYPEKLANPWPKTDLRTCGPLEFFSPDTTAFPMLALAFELGQKGGNAPAIMNAANEAAVSLFLSGRIGFTDIHRIVLEALENTPFETDLSLDALIACDKEVKEKSLYDYK